MRPLSTPRNIVVTPNLLEAEVLLGLPSGALMRASRAEVEEAAGALLRDLQCGAVLIKGGHALGGGRAADVLVSAPESPGELYALNGLNGAQLKAAKSGASRAVWLSLGVVPSEHTHGTGCSLSSAIATVPYFLMDPAIFNE